LPLDARTDEVADEDDLRSQKGPHPIDRLDRQRWKGRVDVVIEIETESGSGDAIRLVCKHLF
jgi:hypothetical protein